ncbi:cytochrome P450 71A26-like isoform X1 [Pistacia vera]|uniref:cytochrome P450 71A26-like isoform X1 n=1 Tax=Pistacia vera TaxID=55513 RepID=UPI001262F181|nr:cytochrome P450 71A26-like isoform X1 [Pistacia vera]
MLHSSFIYVLPFIFSALIFFLTKWIFPSSIIRKHLPPSPMKLPILGNLHQIGLYPHRSLHSLAQRYGPFMLLHFGRKPFLIISSAAAAREIMKTHDLIFSNRPKSSIGDRLLYGCKDVAAAPYGEYWRQMRSICVLQLLSNTRVNSFRTVREEEIAFLIKKIASSASFSLPLNLSEMFSLLTNDVICRAAFRRKYSGGESGRKFKKMLGELTELLGGFNVGDFIPWLSWVNLFNGVDAKVEKVAKEFDEFLDEVVEEHLRESGSYLSEGEKDFVDVLLEIQRDKTDGFSIDRVGIKALILDIFAGGTDTTYTVLEWAMTELLRKPGVMKVLQNEVRGIVNGKEIIKKEDLDKMHYLKAVLKETLRLHPPIPLLVPRESTKDVKIKNYDISAGTTVITNAWAIGRDPNIWDKPEEFRPERFLNNSIDFKGHDFELIPFGAGRRGCPGVLFAMSTNEIVLANLVNKFDWSLPFGARVEDLDMTECTGLTIHRKVPLLAVATPTSC